MNQASLTRIGHLCRLMPARHLVLGGLLLASCSSSQNGSSGSGGADSSAGTSSAGTSSGGALNGAGASNGGSSAGSVFDCTADATPAAMVDVPAGDFPMGCNSAVDTECSDDEKPQHTVTLSAFKIDRTEVTQGQYAACISAGACNAPLCTW